VGQNRDRATRGVDEFVVIVDAELVILDIAHELPNCILAKAAGTQRSAPSFADIAPSFLTPGLLGGDRP